MAYTKFEQTYVDAYLNNMYPDVEEEQPQDTMLAAAPTTEPTGQVTVSGFEPQQVRTDVQPELGVARPIPQNKAQEALGYIGELLTKAGVQLDKVGIDIPVLGRISLKDLTVGESGKVLEDMALGFYPVEGAGGFISGTTRIKPDPALELLNIAPIAGAAAKAGGKAVIKGATKAVQATKGMPVGMSTQMVGEGVSELGFYSAAKEAVDAIQQPKGTGEQFLKQIEKTPGVKPDEIKWTGLDDFLKSKKTVTKAEVQEYLDKNRVDIKEVRLGEQETYNPARLQQLENEWSKLKQHPIDDPSFGEEKYDEMIRLMNIRDRSTTDSLYKLYDEAITDGQMAQRMGNKALADKFFKEAELYNTRAEKLDLEGLGMDAPTKFSKYTLPGGENYREILLTLPSKQTSPSEIAFKSTDDVDNFLTDMSMSGYENLDYGRLNDGNVVQFGNAIPSNVMQIIRNNDGEIITGKATAGSTYGSPHFEQQNILAHMRVNDRVDADGKKVLFVEEVQSDWHQAGRKKGYQTGNAVKELHDYEFNLPTRAREAIKADFLKNGFTEAKADKLSTSLVRSTDFNGMAKYLDEVEKYTEIAQKAFNKNKLVPDAPFKTTWHELALKRAIQLASEGGYDRVAFTTGKTQAERYDLSKQISEVHLSGTDLVAYDKNGDTVIKQTGVTKDNLADYIGKEPAQKLLDQKPQGTLRSISGVDLQVGGEGMKGFYDTILPKFLDKYAKKWDAKTSQMNMFISPRDGSVQIQYIDVTPKMKESVLTKGQPLFAVGGAGAAMQQEDNK
jgi:hypothetical protein